MSFTENKVLTSLRGFPEINGSKVAIGVSGGCDSLALLLALYKYSKEQNITLYAITIDHQLRPSSLEEAIYVAKICKKLNIQHEILTWNHTTDKISNLEASAREARYNLFAEFCHKNKIKYLLTAHHMNDQVETFFLRLLRGSGIDGLAAMDTRAKLFNITILRPFLNIQKHELIQFLEENNIKWIEDESNSDTRFLRNKVRNFLNTFQDNYIITNRINSAINEIKKYKDQIQEKFHLIKNQVVECPSFGIGLIHLKKLFETDEDIALRILASICMKISGNIYKPRFEKLKRVFREIKEYYEGKRHKFKTTFYGCVLEDYGLNKIVVYREYNAIQEDIKLICDQTATWDKRFEITLKKPIADVFITHVKQGEFNQLLEKIRKTDFKKYKELRQITGVEKNIFYTLPVAKYKDNYLLDCSYMEIKEINHTNL